MSWFDQERHPCRLDWGAAGAERAGGRGDAVAVVDVLSFGTTVASGLAEGLAVMPCVDTDDLDALADEHRAEVAARRELAEGGISLSPLSLTGAARVERVLLRSPNGASCVRAAAAAGSPLVVACGLVNVRATARALGAWLSDQGSVTVIACGEHWSTIADGARAGLRVATEDLLGAGAIVATLRETEGAERSGWCSPEARAAELAWLGARAEIEAVLRMCVSGLELRRRGFGDDVTRAAAVDALDVAAVLEEDGWFRPVRQRGA